VFKYTLEFIIAYIHTKRKYPTYNKKRLTKLFTSWAGTCLLKHIIEEKIEGRIGVTGR
jgi:hypothetical protein